MRVAVLSDMHGNLTALDAVLADVGRERPDRLVCLGDVASGGPQPRATLARLRDLGCPVVMGNTDAWLLDPQPRGTGDERQARIDAIGRWVAAQLAEQDRAYLRSFRPTVEIALDEGRTLLCYHGSPRSFDGWLPPTIPDQDLERLLAGWTAAVFAGGHTHQPMVRQRGEALVLNAGSVGRALVRDAAGATRNAPWAEYALVRDEAGRLGVELRRVRFDVAAHLRAILASGMPYADWEAANWQQGG